jgi:hypothetical protein
VSHIMRMHLPHVNQPNRNQGADNDADGEHGERELYFPAPFKRIGSHVGYVTTSSPSAWADSGPLPWDV